MKTELLFILFFLLTVYACNKPVTSVDSINIPYTNRNIRIDGKVDDWKTFYQATFQDTLQEINTPGSYAIEEIFPEGYYQNHVIQPLSRNTVKALMCWNKSALFIAFMVDDEHFVAEFLGAKDNPNIFLNDGIEIYIDTRHDSEGKMDANDYHFIVDLLNQQCIFKGDLYLHKFDTLLVPQQLGQNIIIESQVSYIGVNNGLKNGKQYIVEMKIPFLSIGMQPKEGERIRLDLCVNDSDYLLSELKLAKKDLHFTWAFNWSGLGDFGFPDTWKTAVLTGKPTLYHELADRYKYSWIYILGVFILISVVIISFLIYRVKKHGKLPNVEIINKIILFNVSSPKQNAENEHNPHLTKVTQYIYSNITLKISPQDVALNNNLSLRSLQRLTKKELDCTPVALINSLKLQYARDVLSQNREKTISQVAYESGFNDPSYFSKLFKEHFGISPKNFVDGKGDTATKY